LNTRWSSAATVLAGDYIFARAATFAAATDSVDLQSIFADTLATIVSGEINQLFNSRGEVSRNDYYKRIYAKTASLFQACTQCASLISPVNEIVVENMKSYGYEIGMAFQIVDDILDFTGEQTTVGKPVASDLRQGLVTLPAIYYAEAYPDDEDLKAVLSGKSEEAQIMRVVESIRGSGSIERSMEEAQKYVNRGINSLVDMPENEERQALIELAHYIVDRDI
jgi:geranylgeranyl pyrophosphate synthase